jgi:hypothetical protein
LLAVQSIGALIGGLLMIAGKLSERSAGNYVHLSFHPGAVPEAEIAASPQEFTAVATRVVELAVAGAGEVVFAADGSGLSTLSIRVNSGKLVVAVEGSILTVGGDAEAIDLFGRNLPTDASLTAGYHVHFEHAGREQFVSVKSLPLVMLVDRTQEVQLGTTAMDSP